MIETTADNTSRGWIAALTGAFCVLSGVAASALFLPHQSLWIDESTQLYGLPLGPVEQVRWLAGWSHHDFGVPDDRMPPLSYWAGWAWSEAFGFSETPMRWLGVVEVAGATLLIFLTARRAWGLLAAVAAALVFALSPNVVVESVEIRAYPLFLLTSAATFACLFRFLEGPAGTSRRWLMALTACCVLTTYTHFFGLVLAGGVMLAALVLERARGGSIGPVVASIGVVGLAALGLAPFVAASAAMSGAVPDSRFIPEDRVGGLVRLVYRSFFHPALAINRVALGMALLGVVLAGVAAFAPKRRSAAAGLGLVVALSSGALVVTAAQFALRSFVAASASYNAWMLPALALLLGSGLSARSRTARAAAAMGLALIVASYAYGDVQLAVRGDCFAHTGFRAVESLINRYGTERVAVVHDESNRTAWHIYAPIHYRFHGKVREYLYSGAESDGVRVIDYPKHQAVLDPLRLPADYLIVVHSAAETSAAITAQIRDGVRPLGDGPMAKALKADGRWALIGESMTLAFVATDIDVFERIQPTPTTSRADATDPPR